MIPYFGLCYGMQIATIEFARDVCRLKDANTEEIDPKTPNPVIHIMPDQKEKLRKKDFGGSMRLGEYPCQLQAGSISLGAYKKYWPKELLTANSQPQTILERHRHRYEVNNDYRDQLEKAGLRIAGINPDRDLVEIVEVKDHPFFVGVQFQPEFLSRPEMPHPLFMEFIDQASKK